MSEIKANAKGFLNIDELLETEEGLNGLSYVMKMFGFATMEEAAHSIKTRPSREQFFRDYLVKTCGIEFLINM